MNENFPQLVGKTMYLGIGAQKSGTTWLSGYLSDHPEIYMSALQEMHFWGNCTTTDQWPTPTFEKRLIRLQSDGSKSLSMFNHIAALQDRLDMNGDIEKYAAYFDKRVRQQHAFGEISPAYCKLTVDEFTLIKQHFPDTKIIFLLRNPVDRLWSQIRFSEEAETLQEMEQKIDGAFQRNVYMDRSDYVSAIRTIRSVFSPKTYTSSSLSTYSNRTPWICILARSPKNAMYPSKCRCIRSYVYHGTAFGTAIYVCAGFVWRGYSKQLAQRCLRTA